MLGMKKLAKYMWASQVKMTEGSEGDYIWINLLLSKTKKISFNLFRLSGFVALEVFFFIKLHIVWEDK